jgi:hypothetical protein
MTLIQDSKVEAVGDIQARGKVRQYLPILLVAGLGGMNR